MIQMPILDSGKPTRSSPRPPRLLPKSSLPHREQDIIGDRHYHSAAGTVPEQLAVVDADWRIVSANSPWVRAARRGGHDTLLMPGQNLRHYYEWYLIAGVDMAASALEALRQIEAGEQDEITTVFESFDTGDRLQLSITAFELDGARYATVTRTDLTELHDLRRERMLLNAGLVRAHSRLLHAQESERQRVARELHDSVAQHLTGITLGLAMLRQQQLTPDTMPILDDVSALLDCFYRDLRGLTYLFHPPELERAGLHEAIRSLCRGLAKRSGIELALRIDGIDRRRGSTVEVTLYRVALEALINVHRHANASRLTVRLCDRAGGLILIVEDDGVGLAGTDAARDGVGFPAWWRG